jgi:hypothetical protein
MISFTYNLPALRIIPVRDTDASGDYFYLITSPATIPEMPCYDSKRALGDKVIRKPRSVLSYYLNKITDFHAITSKCP